MPFDRIYIDAGLFGYVVAYLPLAIFVLWQIYSRMLRPLPRPWLRRSLVFITTGTVLTAPFGDVIAISAEAKRLCKEQAGLHIYKTAEADGFIGYIGGGIGYWSKYGFTYTEAGGRGGKKLRYTMQNGEAVREEVPEYISRYQLQISTDSRSISKHFSRNTDRVIDRVTREVLGELVTVFIYPGWLDSLFIGVTGTGSGFRPWRCGEEPPPGRTEKLNFEDVVLGTLKPHRNAEGERK